MGEEGWERGPGSYQSVPNNGNRDPIPNLDKYMYCVCNLLLPIVNLYSFHFSCLVQNHYSVSAGNLDDVYI